MPAPLSKRDPAVAAILRDWRALTGGRTTSDDERPTLVACSGGPDSVALALALHAARGLAGLLHIVHDLRSPEFARADADFVRDLAAELGVPFAERAIAVPRDTGSLEAAARRARYGALAQLASEHPARFVATGHHAGDQVETLIMRLARGAGPAGLRGILPKRRLSPTTTLVRPCLRVERADLERLCAAAGVIPRRDLTNDDPSMARNAIRMRIAPELSRLFPGFAPRLGDLADRMRAIDAALRTQADSLRNAAVIKREGGETHLDRGMLRAAAPALTHAVLRELVTQHGERGADRATWRSGVRLVRSVRDAVGGERRFRVGAAEVVVTASVVVVRRV